MIKYPIFVLTTDNNELYVIRMNLAGQYEVFTGHQCHTQPTLEVFNSQDEFLPWIKEKFYD